MPRTESSLVEREPALRATGAVDTIGDPCCRRATPRRPTGVPSPGYASFGSRPLVPISAPKTRVRRLASDYSSGSRLHSPRLRDCTPARAWRKPVPEPEPEPASTLRLHEPRPAPPSSALRPTFRLELGASATRTDRPAPSDPSPSDPSPSDLEPTTQSQRPGANDPEPTARRQRPGANNPEPAIRLPATGVSDPAPATRLAATGVSDPAPATRTQRPGPSDPYPAYRGSAPGNPYQAIGAKDRRSRTCVD